MSFLEASAPDVALVEAFMHRPLAGRFAVVVRRADGSPVVIENEPHLRDGTPMPTLFWLVDATLNQRVSRLEGDGGVRRLEGLVDPARLRRAHEEYARLRRAATRRHDLVAPVGGVGGTRRGVKCLHAHLAYYLVGGDDPVGELVAAAVDPGPLVRVSRDA